MNILSSNDVGPSDQYTRTKRCYKDKGYVDSSKAFDVSTNSDPTPSIPAIDFKQGIIPGVGVSVNVFMPT